MKVTKILTIKTPTNDGTPCKQRVDLLSNGTMDDGIHIRKLLLIDNQDDFESCCRMGFAKGREFNHKVLMLQDFNIKVSTFNRIAEELNQLKK